MDTPLNKKRNWLFAVVGLCAWVLNCVLFSDSPNSHCNFVLGVGWSIPRDRYHWASLTLRAMLLSPLAGGGGWSLVPIMSWTHPLQIFKIYLVLYEIAAEKPMWKTDLKNKSVLTRCQHREHVHFSTVTANEIEKSFSLLLFSVLNFSSSIWFT